MELSEAREIIREVDEAMAGLFVRRMEAVRAVADYKRARGLPIEDREQEARVIAGRGALVEDPELREFYVRFLREAIELSKRWQQRLIAGLQVAYCGVEGAFAQIAAGRIFPEGSLCPFPSFEAAYASVEAGDCDVAVLPIENSYAGEVGQVLDLMLSGSLYVNGVYDLSISQNLLGLPGARLEDVRTVLSHPQALSQCRGYLQRRGLTARSAPNTAMAAREVAELGDPSLAAIASRETAQLYGLALLDHDIHESSANTTRFAVFARAESRPAEKREGGAFLLLFTVKDEAGGLAKAINIISAYGFNLRVLRSRPMKHLPWHYYFYAEAEGDDGSENGRRMLSALRGACPMVKVAGRYTAADNALQGGETI
ncbi:MAG: chorismate mutase [Oscillospiraceae bacterium]|nr:chorismate mutase [Oscillospiraceae bacterium]